MEDVIDMDNPDGAPLSPPSSERAEEVAPLSSQADRPPQAEGDLSPGEEEAVAEAIQASEQALLSAAMARAAAASAASVATNPARADEPLLQS